MTIFYVITLRVGKNCVLLSFNETLNQNMPPPKIVLIFSYGVLPKTIVPNYLDAMVFIFKSLKLLSFKKIIIKKKYPAEKIKSIYYCNLKSTKITILNTHFLLNKVNIFFICYKHKNPDYTIH